MPLTRIKNKGLGNSVSFENINDTGTEGTKVAKGTTAQRPTGVSVGTIRFNSDTDAAEIYKADDGTGSAGWAAISGGGPAVGTDSIIRTNAPTIVENITIGPTANGDAKYTNGMTAGPVSINNGFTVTIENGASWSIR